MLHDHRAVTVDDLPRRAAAAIAAADAEVAAAIAASPDVAAIVHLDEAMRIVADAYGAGPFLARAHPDPEIRVAAAKAEEELNQWSTGVVFRDDVAAAVRAVAATEEARRLEGERARSLAFWLRDLRRAGHELPPADRERLEELQRRLVELQIAFGRNLDEWEDHLDVPKDRLAGMPEDYLERLAPGDEPGTYRITMAYPDYLPYLDEGPDRELRRELQHRFWNRAAKENTEILAEAVSIRREIARLLGRPTWAHHAMEPKMADPEAVAAFYDRLVEPLTRRARRELAALAELAAADGIDELRSWDWSYYDTLQKRELGVEPSEVAAYLPLERVVEALFEITSSVFGIDYVPIPDPRAWHDDVTLWGIVELGDDEPFAYFYMDLFPREGKFGHAACFPLAHGGVDADGRRRRPVAAILANFTKPTATNPSLLKHDEAVTLFHEFGHVLHHCLARTELARFGAFATEWDFVEAPSQIMEHWMWEPTVLRRIGRHHETGRPMPDELVERLVATRDHNVALKTLRQIFLGELDLALHGVDDPPHPDDAYRATWPRTLLPFHEGTSFPASFGHLMGGYDAGYYGYLWARVFGDDMFSVFAAVDPLDPEVGRRYRAEVLEPGASRDAIEHLRAFLGRDPSPEAFLRRLGIA
ncbi:MAG TPA: hypothetical protein ENK55_06460 [Actinobacteria bacterium]|nr:hypothetical protein [Actinomycetota bacterium]